MKLKRLISCSLILIMALCVTFSLANDELKRRERELELLKAKMEELDASINENKALQNKTNQKIQKLNSDVKQLEREITDLNTQIDVTETSIGEKKKALAESEIAIDEKNELLNNRLRVMYKSGEIGYLEVLFGAEDFTDLISRIDMLQLILAHDQNLLEEMKVARDAVETQKIDLENKKNELVHLSDEKLNKQNQLSASLSNLLVYKKDLVKDAEALEEMEAQSLAQADQLTVIIKNLKLAETYIGGVMVWPLPNHYEIYSDFGERIHPITKVYSKHTGIDIPAPTGTPIVAAQTGTVVYADWFGTYGKAIIIDHGGGLTTLYGHCSEINVAVGQAIKKGSKVGLVGSTGYSTGPHLHFEVRENGEYVDPKAYVKP